MPLLVAMSAFQSRTQDDALDALLPHIHDGLVDGVQLTPGNLPSPGFGERVEALAKAGVTVRYHHGFSWTHYRRAVYDSSGRAVDIGRDHSIHPPRTHAPDRGLWRARQRRGSPTTSPTPVATWSKWLPIAVEQDLLVETMYPGYLLGSAAELNDAMDAELRLCVDIAHLSIVHSAGLLDAATCARLLAYPRIEEVHISRSRGGRDTHSPITTDTPWLGWAQERIADLPVVLESYWHRTPSEQQRQQLNMIQSGRHATTAYP